MKVVYEIKLEVLIKCVDGYQTGKAIKEAVNKALWDVEIFRDVDILNIQVDPSYSELDIEIALKKAQDARRKDL